jgi:hypothetical protein
MYTLSLIFVFNVLVCHLKSHQQRCPMSAVCYEGGVGGRSRAGLRLSLNRSISEPGPATTITVTTPTNSKRFRLEPIPSLPASLPASPNSDGTNLSSALILNKVCIVIYTLFNNVLSNVYSYRLIGDQSSVIKN